MKNRLKILAFTLALIFIFISGNPMVLAKQSGEAAVRSENLFDGMSAYEARNAAKKSSGNVLQFQTFDAGSAGNESKLKLVQDGSKFYMIAENCVGLESMDIVINYNSDVASAVFVENGKDAEKLEPSIYGYRNWYTFEYNNRVAGELKYGAYFKQHLWSFEDFEQNTLPEYENKITEPEYFELAVLIFDIADGKAAEELELTFEARVNLSGEEINEFATEIVYANSGNNGNDSESLFRLKQKGSEFYLIAENCIGLASMDFVITYQNADSVNVVNGSDARLVTNRNYSYRNEFVSAYGNNDGELLYGAYFKEHLWTAEEFEANASSGYENKILNPENFEIAVLTFVTDDNIAGRELNIDFSASVSFVTENGTEKFENFKTVVEYETAGEEITTEEITTEEITTEEITTEEITTEEITTEEITTEEITTEEITTEEITTEEITTADIYPDEIPSDGSDDSADIENDNKCEHICHNKNIIVKKVIWPIVRFFWKMFALNPVCACGEQHY